MTPDGSHHCPRPYTPIRRVPVGRMLIDRNMIEQEDLERALELQRERGDKLGKILVDMGSIAQRDMLAVLSEQLGSPAGDLDGPPPVGAGNRRPLAPLHAPVPRSSRCAQGCRPDHRDGRSAGFRNHGGGARLTPV